MIIVTALPNTTQSRTFKYSFEDLNITEREWMEMSYGDREKCIQLVLDNEHEQPYWEVDSIEI